MNMFRYLKRWRFHIFLVLLVVLGCFMRFHNIEKKSLWADELFTLSMAQYHPLVPEAGQPWYRATSVMDIRDGDTFLSAKAGEQSPPLQDLLEKASVHLLGSSDFAARLPGALAACALLAWFGWFAARATDPWERSVLTWSLLLLT
ncbi:MAG: rane protein-like protein, partial [Rhodoferax sp.]|nr:rane protein-like protein [Rhodoferax sp.]